MRHSLNRIACLFLLVVVLAPIELRAQPNPNRLTIAAYNVEFFLDVFDDPYTFDEGHEPKPRAEIQSIAKAIRALNPDVITFEELENEGVLRAMNREFLADMGYEYLAVANTNSDRGQNLGVLSRRPIVSVTSHRWRELTLAGETQTWHFARDLWQVRIQATATQIVDLYSVHLKSKYDSPDDKESVKYRLAEATAARQIIAENMTKQPDQLAVMLGDFNDEPQSLTLKTLLAPQTDGKPFLIDAHAKLAPDTRITYLKEPYRSTIDYILVSPALVKMSIPNSARVLSDPSVLGGSDHAPISASFDLSRN
ncbi:MAG: endonuclease/exonuclease/phosphatase family protein [Phycisphaeraceae bacterium]|nr:endonuclease/exonuclease/phosphatase family protein [Phycisphaeraceae bacterium]